MSPLVAGRQKPVLGPETWQHLGKGGRVGVVAVDAALPLAWAPSQIPIALHPAMGTTLVVPGLGSMALRAERLHVGEIERPPIGQAEPIVIARMVAAQACQPAMREHQPLVKLPQGVSRSLPGLGSQIRMATGTRNGHWFPMHIDFTRGNAWRSLGAMDDDRIRWPRRIS
jgi:hypothetical protein